MFLANSTENVESRIPKYSRGTKNSSRPFFGFKVLKSTKLHKLLLIMFFFLWKVNQKNVNMLFHFRLWHSSVRKCTTTPPPPKKKKIRTNWSIYSWLDQMFSHFPREGTHPEHQHNMSKQTDFPFNNSSLLPHSMCFPVPCICANL